MFLICNQVLTLDSKSFWSESPQWISNEKKVIFVSRVLHFISKFYIWALWLYHSMNGFMIRLSSKLTLIYTWISPKINDFLPNIWYLGCLNTILYSAFLALEYMVGFRSWKHLTKQVQLVKPIFLVKSKCKGIKKYSFLL